MLIVRICGEGRGAPMKKS